MKFYECGICGNIIKYEKESGIPVRCCGQKMNEIIPGTSDGASEKHVPYVTVKGNRVVVEIGEVAHPMVEEHYIQWIVIETKLGSQKANLTPESKPRAEFILAEGDEFVAAYEYCNIHSLWMSKEVHK